jgi:hypothetical protein
MMYSEVAMVRRITIWATVGFLVACAWAIYAAITPAEFLVRNLHEPLVRAGFVSCPVLFLADTHAIKLWWVLLINAATYGAAGFAIELLRRRTNPAVQTS